MTPKKTFSTEDKHLEPSTQTGLTATLPTAKRLGSESDGFDSLWMGAHVTDLTSPPAELVSFLESQLEPHILCDRQYRILAANSAYRTQTGATDDVIGRKCHEVSHRYALPCDQVGETCPLTRSLESGMREHVLHLHHTPTGKSYERIELTPLRDAAGEVSFFIEKLEHLSVHKTRRNGNALVGASPAFMQLMELVARVAPSDASVLLQGESGTGKELVAQAIHDASARAERPFVVVDCSGLPETLFESEFFGHERGAFTGATTRQPGLIEAASGGTLFLDEVGDIPLSIQVKLLRLLETGTYRRVGGTELRHAAVRLVSATHRCLRDRVATGAFRQDLFYRLSTFPIPIPPLRERRADLPELIDALMQRVVRHRRYLFTPAALAVLQAYDYPGNVRELRNVLERASLMCDGEIIGVEHLPRELRQPAGDAGSDPVTVVQQPAGWRDIEQKALQEQIDQHRGTRRELAARLGVSERTLYRMIRRMGS
jgi:two-component system response regulator HydG